MQFKKKPVNFTNHPFFIKKTSFHLSLEEFSNFILKHIKWSNYQKSYNNNLKMKLNCRKL